jgi:hypothetical protein
MLPRSWKQTIEGLWEVTMTFDQVALEAALDDALFVRPKRLTRRRRIGSNAEEQLLRPVR